MARNRLSFEMILLEKKLNSLKSFIHLGLNLFHATCFSPYPLKTKHLEKVALPTP